MESLKEQALNCLTMVGCRLASSKEDPDSNVSGMQVLLPRDKYTLELMRRATEKDLVTTYGHLGISIQETGRMDLNMAKGPSYT